MHNFERDPAKSGRNAAGGTCKHCDGYEYNGEEHPTHLRRHWFEPIPELPNYCIRCSLRKEDLIHSGFAAAPAVGPVPAAPGVEQKRRPGRPAGITMPCGWQCGFGLTLQTFDRHWRECPKRPGGKA